MWWETQKTHYQNMSTQSRDRKNTKINFKHQSKIELQDRINKRERERERERERIITFFLERMWEKNTKLSKSCYIIE